VNTYSNPEGAHLVTATCRLVLPLPFRRGDGRGERSVWINYLLIGLIAIGLLTACSKKNEPATSAAQPPKEEESRIQHTTNGETIIKLDAETQKLMGLQTVSLEAAELNKEIKCFGRVLDSSALAASVAEHITAQSASAASQAELQRLKTLVAQSNASARALEAAQAAAARDMAQKESVRLRLLSSWGAAIAERQDLPEFAQSLGKLDSVLVQLNLHTDEALIEMPQIARLIANTAQTATVEAKFLSLAPSVDPQLQGQALLFLVSPNRSHLVPGAALTAYIPVSGEKQSGVNLPRDAIVRRDGASWVYAQTSPETFRRTEVHLETPLTNGWFITTLKTGDKVVTAGAGQILSEEAKE
jgi:hypothetical protein